MPEFLDAKERDGGELSGSTGLAAHVVVESLLKILRGTDVNSARAEAKKVDHARAIRRASATNVFTPLVYAGHRP